MGKERVELHQKGTLKYRFCQYEDVLGRPDSHYTRGTRVYACEHRTEVVDMVVSGKDLKEARNKLRDLVGGLNRLPDTVSFDLDEMSYCLRPEGGEQPICGDWFSDSDQAYYSWMRRLKKGSMPVSSGDKKDGEDSTKKGGNTETRVEGSVIKSTRFTTTYLDLPGMPHTLPNGQVVWR